MFDYVRNNTRLMGILLALLIVPAFVLVGVDGYRKFDGQGETVAVVGGKAIKKDEWDNAHRREVDNIRSRQPNIDMKMLDTDDARFGTLERLVRERVLLTAAQKMNLSTSNQKLAADLQQNEVIAGLRKADGSLDMDRYRQLLAGQGMSPEMFEAQVRQDLSMRQVTQAVTASSLVTPAVAQPSLQAFFERREVQWARFDTNAFKGKVQVTDEEVAAHYNAHPALFQAAEKADIEYVVLDLASVTENITISDADVKSYFDQNLARYSTKEERRASHILINAATSAPAAEKAAAKAKATELLAQVKGSTGKFAELAKKHSQDPGSAPNGGDLSFFQKGAMVKPFEDAAFALKKGEVSDLVESEFGYHIILLTDVRPAVVRPMEQVKPDIVADLKKQQAQREFADKADVFGNLVYEQADSFAPVTERLKLKVQTAKDLGRLPGPGTPPLLANAKLLEAVFAADSVEKKRNTAAVEVGANQLVAARVLAYRPAHTLPLEEVKPSVKAQLVSDKAQAMAKAEGEQSLAAWKGGAEGKLSAPAEIARDKPTALRQAEIVAALRADTATLPAWVGVDLGANGYTVIKVNKVQARAAPTADLAAQELRQYDQWWSSAEGLAYYEALKKRLKVEIKVAKPVAKTGVDVKS
ncbi:MAG: SurA N-terminal domain-containing protein [Burkholderiales bacterium]|nr:SurA N-terminal domain-containing protein [Burkholderiales bacterium]